MLLSRKDVVKDGGVSLNGIGKLLVGREGCRGRARWDILPGARDG